MAADTDSSLEAQPSFGQSTPDQGDTLEIPSQAGARHPFIPRPELIDALIGQESGGKAGAIGKAGERGLMQILPGTAAQYGIRPEQLTDPTINRQTGTRYFSDLLKKYDGNEFLALVAYNSGPGRVDKGELLPQSVKYASNILGKVKSGKDSMPTMQAQPGGTKQSAQPVPSLLSRIGGLFEGTANAQETGPGMPANLPPLPTGEIYNPGGGAPSDPTTGDPTVSTVPNANTPTPPANLPPLPTGERYDPSQWKASIGMGPGGLRFNMQQQTPPANVRTQEATAKIVLGQVNDAIGYYDKTIKPVENQFTGSLLTKGGRQGFMQPFEATHSRYAQALGLSAGDPRVKTLYDKAGPIMAEQLKALIGGRVGQGMIEGPLAPHLPNIEQDSLPRIREKLEDLKTNVPIILQNIQQMRAQGMTDDQILAQPPSWPSDGQSDTGEPPPPEGFQ